MYITSFLLPGTWVIQSVFYYQADRIARHTFLDIGEIMTRQLGEDRNQLLVSRLEL
jgi:hypothetical protein